MSNLTEENRQLFEQLQNAFLESSITPDIEATIKSAVSRRVERTHPDILKEVKVTMRQEKAEKVSAYIDVMNVKLILDESKHIMATMLDELRGNLDEIEVMRLLKGNANLYRVTTRMNLKIEVDIVSE
ncbi:MAG: hypothetical protein K0R18_102 [Bacillales bacterium]|jgi:hypothetical protein|nr:hypothetical protein [Bacillales bacterium]